MSDKTHPSAQPPSKVALRLGNLPPRNKSFVGNFPRTPSQVNPENPPWPAFRGYHEYSFAYDVMGRRLPTILGKAIDDVVLTLNEQHDEDRMVDLVQCIDKMDELMDDLTNNRTLTPIPDDGEGDIPLWNKEIAKYFREKDFLSAPWLFAEAYKYRRLHSCFSQSKFWKDYDVFFRQKCDTFARSGTAVFELSSRFAHPFTYKQGTTEAEQLEARRLVFEELTQVCLWGNSTDLSLLIDMTEEDIKRLQSTGGEHLAATQKNILGNHLPKLWEKVKDLKGGRIDFVLDNAGFELFCDLVYADWLIQSGMCRDVHFHGKRFAWFVSDVTKNDWAWLINSCCYGRLFPEASQEDLSSLREMGKRWKHYEETGQFVYEQHPFWISGYTFWELIREAPDLFLNLSKSDLVLFKGDLNHRKLTYDCNAPASTSFYDAIGSLASTPGAPAVLSLRTIKSDVVVGLDQAVADRLDKEEPGWRISGKYAVVLLTNGKKGELVQFE